jgi:hypothetical protein
VDKAVQQWGDRDALISLHQGHRLSFRKMKEEVSNSSKLLLRLLNLFVVSITYENSQLTVLGLSVSGTLDIM